MNETAGFATLLSAPRLGRWREHGACRGNDTAEWLPEKGISRHNPRVVEARRICIEDCTVRSECLEYAMGWRYAVGIWGGTSGRERDRIRNQERVAA